jgi:outer membrane protein assembly factor BamB
MLRFRKLNIVVSLSLAAFAVAPAGASAAADETTAYQVTPGHTGFSSGGSLERPPLRTRWTRALGTSTSYPLVAAGRVYVIAYDPQHAGGTLLALDAVTGATLWSRPVAGTGQLAYDAGRVFIAERSGTVVAVAADTGATQWARVLPEPFTLQTPVAAGGVLYVASAWSGGAVYALAGADGSTLWSEPFYYGGSPGVDGSFVYVSDGYEGATQAFARADGAPAWVGSAQCFVGNGQVLTDGARVIGPWSSACGALSDAATGRLLDSFAASTAPASAGDVAIALNGSTLQARSLTTGVLLWEFTGDGSLRSAPVIVNETVYAGSADGTLFAVDLRTGAQLWSGQVADAGTVAGATGIAPGDGLLAVPSGGTLTALESAQAPRPGLDLQISSGPDGPTTATAATLTFGSSATPAAEMCRLDLAAWTACAATATFTGLADGPHMFEVRTLDAAGTAVALAARGWSVDTKIPTATITGAPTGVSNSTYVSLTVSADDPEAQLRCRLDGAAWVACPTTWGGSLQYSSLADGPHRLDVRARNALGSIQATPTTVTWIVDTAPDTQITSSPPAVTTATNAAFAFVASEYGTTFQCRQDGGAWSTCASPTSLTGLTDGLHEFDVRAVNSAGNYDTTPASWYWTVDTRAPRTQAALVPGSGRAAGYSFTFAADESAVTFECRLDSAAWLPCASGVAYAGLAPGAHEVDVRATDAAGNRESPGAIVSFTVPATAAQTVTAPTTIPSRSSFVATVPAPQLDTKTLARMLADAGAAVLTRSTRHQLLAAPTIRVYAAGPATVSIDVSTRTGGRSVTLARAQAKLSAAGSHALRLRPTAAGRRALARPGRLGLTVRATMAPVAGPAASARAAAHV